jgi:hypothetical protein
MDVCDAREGVMAGYGFEESIRQSAAAHNQDVARVAALAAAALIAQAQANLAIALDGPGRGRRISKEMDGDGDD